MNERMDPTFSRPAPARPRVQAPARPRARDRERERPTPWMASAAVLIVLACAAAGWWFWLSRPEPAPAGSPPLALAPAPVAQAEPPPPQLLPAEPGAVLQAEGVTNALIDLLGRDAVLKFLETTDFPRKVVATLDNLGRDHAPVMAWPVRPSPGRFLAEGDAASPSVASANARRYAPFVSFVNGIDATRAVDLYRRMYPLLQQQYRELGFGDRSLHARVFQVIDLLLETPEPAQPPRLVLTEVKGPVPSLRPWTRYEYADDAYQRLAAGQKILLRVGPDNRKVLKAKLREIRGALAAVSVGQSRP